MTPEEYYEQNEDVKEYVDKFCAKHQIAVEVALQYSMIHEYIKYCISR